MPPRRELSNPGGSTAQIDLSGLRNAINAPLQAEGFSDATPAAAQRLLAPRVTADTGLSPSATFADLGPQLASKRASTQSASTGQVGIPLGGLFEQIAGIPGSVVGGLAGGIKDPLTRGFMDEAGINSRAEQLTQATLEQMGIGAEGIDAATMGQIQAGSLRDAQAEAKQQNAQTAGAVVTGTVVQEGLNAAIALNTMNNAIDSQVKQMTRETNRFINGVEFNARLRSQAKNLVSVKENLRTIDSILAQTEAGAAGQQQQQFIRNPLLGTRVNA